MQVDWLTVAAQIVNFLVLVWLLQRFLYKPITNAMRHREERIEERLAEAKAAREEAEDQARELRRKEDELEESKEEVLSTAREKAEDLRKRLEAEIRQDMEDKRAAWQEHLVEERDAFVSSLRRQAGKQILDITERVLSDYADTDTAARTVATFAERLMELEPETREQMTRAAAEQDEPSIVHTGSALASADKGKITRAIHEALSTDIDVDYREDRDMVLGVRLTIGDYTVEWSAKKYLKRLETELDEIIDAVARAPKARKDKAATDEAADDEERAETRKKDHETG